MTVTLIAAVDRRSPNRVSPPVCPRCGTHAVTVMNRSTTFVYFSCDACRESLPVPVPVIARGQTLRDRLVERGV